jgi:hypothetical protein
MELTLFLSAKNIVSNRTRNELKCLDRIVFLFISSTKQSCILKSLLLLIAS